MDASDRLACLEAALRDSEQRAADLQQELVRANARLRELAVTDPLTGLKNRSAFDDRLGDEIDRRCRSGRPLSLLLFDVDHLKPFNQHFGLPAGDDVLRTIAGLLQAAARGTDLVARYAGDGFAAVLPDTDRAGAMTLAERCRTAVAEAHWPHWAVTVSGGAATVDGEGGRADALLAAADEALDRSKANGRDQITHAADEAVISYA